MNNSTVVSKRIVGVEGEREEGKGGIKGDGRRLQFGW